MCDRRYARLNANKALTFTAGEWQAVAEVEAVLRIVQFHTTIVQTEKRPMAAFANIVRRNLLTQLRAKSLSVIDVVNVSSSPKVPRKDVAVDNLTAIGKMCLKRAQLEAERRFCGNIGTEITDISGAPVVMTAWQDVAMLMDPRTVRAANRALYVLVVTRVLCWRC